MRLKLQSASRIKETKFRRSPSKFYLKLVLPLRPLKSWKAYNCNLTGNRWRTLEHLVPTTRKYPFDVVNRFTFCFFHGCSNISSAKILPKSTHYAKRDFFPPLPPLSPPPLPPVMTINLSQFCTILSMHAVHSHPHSSVLSRERKNSIRNSPSWQAFLAQKHFFVLRKKSSRGKYKFEWKLVFEIEILN